MTSLKDLVAYVDVDDTLVRSFGSKRIPMTEMVRHVRELSDGGVALYAWSSGGGDYARDAARELGIEECFKAFLPKPNIIIDDQAPADWRRLVHVHPGEATSKTVEEYANAVYDPALVQRGRDR
jgi:hypothetical protein